MGAESSKSIWASPKREWDPAHYLNSSSGLAPDDKLFALLILNQELDDLNLFETVYRNSTLRVCADGGANRLYDAYKKTNGEEEGLYDHLPDCIAGDLDSVRPGVLEFYRKAGVEIRQRGDQYSTDFVKCLDYISEKSLEIPPLFKEEEAGEEGGAGKEREAGKEEVGKEGEAGKEEAEKQEEAGEEETSVTSSQPPAQPDITVLAFGGFGGRVDHSFHSINVLYKTIHTHKVLLLSSENITFLLPSGTHLIRTPRSSFGPTCGLLPVGSRSTIVSTEGLEWDIKSELCGFAHHLVSTSNHLKNEVTMVHSTEAIVFTMELRKLRT